MATNSKIISLEDDDDHVNLLVYANSGSGKTVLCGSDDKVLFIAPEDDGTLSAKRQGSTAKKWPIKSWADIVEAYDYLYDLYDNDPDNKDWNWIAIDSLTEMQDMGMRAILERAIEENPNRDPDIPEIQDWQKYYRQFKRMVKAFNALPVNVIYTALARNEEDEEGEDFLTPDLQGKGYQISQQIASYMTSYGYMQVKRRRGKPAKEGEKGEIEEYRRITWHDSGIIRGKDRTNALAPHTDGLTLKQIRLRTAGANTKKEG